MIVLTIVDFSDDLKLKGEGSDLAITVGFSK